mmetsp:Transcript_25822/g.38149  ORF Transcript_25822/g.38149 Transcript_25822/m.38149 type:complete len:82 (-) Transcript_25822:58-303(-)
MSLSKRSRYRSVQWLKKFWIKLVVQAANNKILLHKRNLAFRISRRFLLSGPMALLRHVYQTPLGGLSVFEFECAVSIDGLI